MISYKYLDNIALADVAFEAAGDSLEELFIAAGRATMEVMTVDLSRIEKRQTRAIHLQDDKVDMLLFQFLQELIFHKDAENLLLLPEQVDIAILQGEFSLDALLSGETADAGKHKLGVDVKAVTLHKFTVERQNGGWSATVVLDI